MLLRELTPQSDVERGAPCERDSAAVNLPPMLRTVK